MLKQDKALPLPLEEVEEPSNTVRNRDKLDPRPILAYISIYDKLNSAAPS
jgi:hypothetical protein